MKKILFVLSMLFALNSYANQCGIVIDFPPGGTSDMYVRMMQKNNPDIRIEYKPGGFSANALNFISQDKDFAFFGSPTMFGSTSPIKDPPVELLRIIVGAPILALTKKSITVDNLSTGKLNIGVPALNTSHHLAGMQMKAANPNIEIIPTGGDNKALPMIQNGDLDLYLVSATAGQKWIQDFDLKNLFTLTFNKPLVINNTTLHVAGFNGIWVHRDANQTQKNKILECVSKAIESPQWKDGVTSIGAQPIDLVGVEKDKAFNNYLRLMRSAGL